MSVEYEGTVVQNEQYKVKKLHMQIQQLEGRLRALQGRYESLDEKYIDETTELKATIKRFMENGIRLPKGRPTTKAAAPKPRGRKVVKNV